MGTAMTFKCHCIFVTMFVVNDQYTLLSCNHSVLTKQFNFDVYNYFFT